MPTYYNHETKIPSLVIAYLESRRTELALPSSTVLPFVPGLRDGTEELSLPCVIVETEQVKFGGSNDIQNVPVKVTLRNKTRGETAPGADVTDLETESTWVAKLRQILCDRTEFLAYCVALAAADYRVCGWGVDSMSTEVSAQDRIRERITNCHVIWRSYETTTN